MVDPQVALIWLSQYTTCRWHHQVSSDMIAKPVLREDTETVLSNGMHAALATTCNAKWCNFALFIMYSLGITHKQFIVLLFLF